MVQPDPSKNCCQCRSYPTLLIPDPTPLIPDPTYLVTTLLSILKILHVKKNLTVKCCDKTTFINILETSKMLTKGAHVILMTPK